MKLIFESHDNPALNEGGGTATFIACDTCGAKIVGPNDGIVVFDQVAGPPYDRTGGVLAIHKGRCETTETQRLPWQDLDVFLRDIVLNTRIDLAATEQRISGPDGLRSWGLHT